MAKKPNWFDALKKVFSPDPDEKKQRKDKEKEKPKKKWLFRRSKSTENLSSSSVQEIPLPHPHSQTNIPSTSHSTPTIPSTSHTIPTLPTLPTLPTVPTVPTGSQGEREREREEHAYSVALASAVAAEAAAVAAQAAAEVVRLTAVGSANHLSQATQRAAGRATEEVAAVRVQTAVRGFLARRALRSLKGLARLKALVDGSTVKRQTEKTLQLIHSQTKIQSEIRSRRRQMVEEKQAVQKLDKLKQRESDKQKVEDWDFSLQTKEQIDTSIQTRQEAAIRRERALAYAFSHQWRNSTSSSRVSNPFITDPTNPNWGWSWLDRWIASRPWETPSKNPKPSPTQPTDQTTDRSSLKSAVQSLKPNPNPNPNPNSHSHSAPPKTSRPSSPSTPRSKISIKQNPNPNSHPHSAPAKTSRPASPSTPRSKISIKPAKARSSSPKPQIRVSNSKEEDSRSIGSVKSERMRRHSVAGSIGDNVSLTSLTSLPVVPSYLQSTESSRLKSRMVYSPISEKVDERERGVKKRLSFASGDKLTGFGLTGLRSGSPVKGRRFSGPAKVELVSLKDEE